MSAIEPAEPGRVHPRAAASALVIRNGAVLLVRRGKGAMAGHWSVPGGHVEPGETAAEAARREVLEETGVAIATERVLDVMDVILRDEAGCITHQYLIAVYLGRWVGGEPAAASDAAAALFVPLGDIASYSLTPGLSELVAAGSRLFANHPQMG